MSDYWSGIFLLGTLVLGVFLGFVVLAVILIAKKKTRLISISIALVSALLSIWIVDRFVVGSFCIPWECIHRELDLDSLLLDNVDLPSGWAVERTYDYAYVARSSSSYRERIFRHNLSTTNNVFYEKIYQYRSVRGASFQYNVLKNELPASYAIQYSKISLQFDLQIRYSSEYDYGCIFYDMKNTICYYLVRYDEYILLVEMPFHRDEISEENFYEIVDLADKKLSIIFENH